jgi:hypothetical protein
MFKEKNIIGMKSISTELNPLNLAFDDIFTHRIFLYKI